VENCTGKFNPELKLDYVSQPFIPHKLLKSKPINKNYITFDSDRASKIVNYKFGDSSVQLETLLPISIAHSEIINGELIKTYSLYKEQNQTEKEFINAWIHDLYIDAATNNISVILGFNSSKCDIHLILPYLPIKKLIGDCSNFK
jgi:hypothetical protein